MYVAIQHRELKLILCIFLKLQHIDNLIHILEQICDYFAYQ